MSNPAVALPPGFRFHPTDEELILHYLRNRASAFPCPVSIVAEVDIYKFDPWELPGKATYGDREWYFFSPRDRKYPNGFRPNRAAASGYWKATGTDKPIRATKGNENIGVKKALVFYKGKPPKGVKTDWIMHEYRLAEARSSLGFRPVKSSDSSMRLDDWVLCRIYKKNNHLQAAPLPLTDQEEGISFSGDAISSTLKSFEQQRAPKLQKHSSISDILEVYSSLSQLFDNSAEMIPPAAENSSLVGQPSVAPLFTNNASAAPQRAQVEPSVVIAESSTKRQRPMDEGYGAISSRLSRPAKRQNCANIHGNFVERLDGNSFDQHFPNQQLLLNSHWGLL